MFNKKILSIVFILSLLNTPIYGTEASRNKQDNNDIKTDTTINDAEVEKIINEYRTYASKIAPDLRNEIIAYRKAISTLNKQKRELYQKLSQKAQDYLAKEQSYRKKLPLKYKKQVNLDNANQVK